MNAVGALRALPHKRGAIVVLFLVWAVWLSFPYFGFGSGSYVRIYDNADSTLAARVALPQTEPSHLDTAWNPQALAGVDQTPVTSWADADGWLFAVLPGWLAYGLVMLLQRLLAGYFTYRLLRDRLRVGVLASLSGGLVYAVFAQMTVNESWAGFTLYDGLALASLPLILWALDDEAGRSFRRRLLLAAGLGLLLGFTSTYALAIFVLPAVVVWLLVRRRTPWRQLIPVLVAFTAAWTVAEAPALWASLLNADQSQRAARVVQEVSLRTAISQKLYFVRGCVLDNQLMVEAAVLGLVAVRFRSRAIIAALASAAAIFFVVAASGLTQTSLRGFMGPLASFELDRFYTLAPFILIVAGALGLDALAVTLRERLPASGGRRGLWTVSVTLLVLMTLAPFASLRVQARIRDEMRAGSTYAGLFERAELRRLAAATSADPPFRVATVYAPQVFAPSSESTWPELFGQLPAYAWSYGLETADGYVVLYPSRYQRFWGQVTAPALHKDAEMRDKYWTWGNRVYLFIPSGGTALDERKDLPLPPVTDVSSFCDLDLLSLANVRYVLSPVHLSGPGLTLVSGEASSTPWPLYVYENAQVLPRVFLAGSTRTYASISELLTGMAAASLQELRTTGFVEAVDARRLSLPPTNGAGGAEVLDYAADDVTISVTARERSLLIATINYSPYWRAFIDGRSAVVVPVDGAFMGVVVPSGLHQVKLRYQPPYSRLLAG